MSDVDREQCEAVTSGGQCERIGAPRIPDTRGLQYLCAKHWRDVCQHQSTQIIGPNPPTDAANGTRSARNADM
ncbi:hypothetical protein ROCKYHORROR_84 [Mycobacterium phage RockyHorror]|uniref:Uncharacterized protein n=1 Tax=Mycobacterium phage RockyHorror TaxID=2920892 RepID=G1BTL5_9CAUD|nr:hypothetical protein FGG57_gp084 [Mycobacterium phage RockyHorror]AEK06787.1 hypothetical protein ROCKYHORROR_84 [Mycobacterium phage RockyHorror]